LIRGEASDLPRECAGLTGCIRVGVTYFGAASTRNRWTAVLLRPILVGQAIAIVVNPVAWICGISGQKYMTAFAGRWVTAVLSACVVIVTGGLYAAGLTR